MTKTGEIFLSKCLEGDASLVSRILKRERRYFTGRNSFNINIKDKNGRTGLGLACMVGASDIVDILTKRYDVSLNTVDMFGAPALLYAAQQQDSQSLQYLLECEDVDINVEDNDCKNAEDYAREAGQIKNIELIRKARKDRMKGSWADKEDSSSSSGDLQQLHSQSDRQQEEETKPKEMIESINLDDDINDTIEVHADHQDLNQEKEVIERVNPLRSSLKEDQGSLHKQLKLIQDNEAAEEKELNVLLEKEKEALKEEYDKKIIETEELFKKKIFDMKQTYSIERFKTQEKLEQLTTCLESFSLDRYLRASQSVNELECPVCLEEMRPPTKIWQCMDGHPICDTCRRRPQVTSCPVCRQELTGRNVLAEKIAHSIFYDK